MYGVPFVLLTAERFDRVKDKWQRLRQARQPWKSKYVINNVLRDFKERVKKAEIKPVGKFCIHTLRKCAGQNWADHLPMVVVKEFLGHSSIETTAEFYSKVDPHHEKAAATAIQELLTEKVTYE